MIDLLGRELIGVTEHRSQIPRKRLSRVGPTPPATDVAVVITFLDCTEMWEYPVVATEGSSDGGGRVGWNSKIRFEDLPDHESTDATMTWIFRVRHNPEAGGGEPRLRPAILRLKTWRCFADVVNAGEKGYPELGVVRSDTHPIHQPVLERGCQHVMPDRPRDHGNIDHVADEWMVLLRDTAVTRCFCP